MQLIKWKQRKMFSTTSKGICYLSKNFNVEDFNGYNVAYLSQKIWFYLEPNIAFFCLLSL